MLAQGCVSQFFTQVSDTIRQNSSPLFVNWWHMTTLLGFDVFWSNCNRHASNHQWTQISVLTRTSCSQVVSLRKFRQNVHHNTFLMFSWEQLDLTLSTSLPVSLFKNESQGLFRLSERLEKTHMRKSRAKSHQTASASTYRYPQTWTWRVLTLILCECVDENNNNSTTIGSTTQRLR